MRLIYGEPLGFKGTLLATMVLFTTVLASGDALAGACKDTTREGVGSANFDTTVRNQTSNMTFDVVIENATPQVQEKLRRYSARPSLQVKSLAASKRRT